jgi:hypothetical protein
MIRRHISDDTLIYLYIFLFFIMFVVGVVYLDKQSTPRLDVEYRLEIINQDSVKIYSIESDKTYVTHIDSIQAVLQEDNL